MRQAIGHGTLHGLKGTSGHLKVGLPHFEVNDVGALTLQGVGTFENVHNHERTHLRKYRIHRF